MDPESTLKQICDHLSKSGNFDECLELIESLADWMISGGFKPKPYLYSARDIIVGAYWYCVDYHSGQWVGKSSMGWPFSFRGSDEYRVQCKLGKLYFPGPFENGPETMSDEKEVYDSLVALYRETADV